MTTPASPTPNGRRPPGRYDGLSREINVEVKNGERKPASEETKKLCAKYRRLLKGSPPQADSPQPPTQEGKP